MPLFRKKNLRSTAMSNFPEPSLYLLIGPRLGARFVAIQVELLYWSRAFASPAAISLIASARPVQRSLRCFRCAAAPSCRGCSLNDGKGHLQKPGGGPAEVGFRRRVTATCSFSASRGRGPMDAARGVRAAAPQPWLAVLTGSRRRSAYPRTPRAARMAAADVRQIGERRFQAIHRLPRCSARQCRDGRAQGGPDFSRRQPPGVHRTLQTCRPVVDGKRSASNRAPRASTDARFGVDCRRSLCHSPRRDRAQFKTFLPSSREREVRTKSERVSRSKVAKVRLKLPQPVEVGHPGQANKAVPAGWIRRIVDARFATQ